MHTHWEITHQHVLRFMRSHRHVHSHDASYINTCRTCSFSGNPEAGVHPGELKSSFSGSMEAYAPPSAAHPRGYLTPTEFHCNHCVLHLQVFWQPRAAIIMSQRLADSKLMAAGTRQPDLPYQVITSEAVAILQVTALSGCLPVVAALPLSSITACSFIRRSMQLPFPCTGCR